MIRPHRGFTLIEVLLATTLLAAGLSLAFLTLRNAGLATERATVVAADSERLRAVSGFLRRQLAAALLVAIEYDASRGEAVYFEAGKDEIRYVAAMPGYLSRGGPHLQTLRLVRAGPGYRLEFQHQLLGDDGALPPEREPELLLSGIAEGEFSVRGLDADGGPGPWQQDWPQASQLPRTVRLQLRMFDGRRHFPDLLVTPRLGQAGQPAPRTGNPVPDRSGEPLE